MDWEHIDWKALERMRQIFLAGNAGTGDYWQAESDLASYDATYAQRIGWKWDYVLEELARRGWRPPAGEVLDWGCGSGIASRAFLDHFGRDSVSKLNYWDRSPLAMQFAARRAREKYPGLTVSTGMVEQPATILLSHVLTELPAEEIERLADHWAERAAAILWVEPGTYEASLALIALRERLRSRLRVIAPCTHQEQCGILSPGNEAHWCHHFAAPPAAVFTDSDWGKFAHLTGIDLRSLPVSFLVLDQRLPAPPPEGATRVLGRPRVYKGFATLLGSNAEGVREHRLSKRKFPEEYRRAKKGELEPLQVWQTERDEIIATRPLLLPREE